MKRISILAVVLSATLAGTTLQAGVPAPQIPEAIRSLHLALSKSPPAEVEENVKLAKAVAAAVKKLEKAIDALEDENLKKAVGSTVGALKKMLKAGLDGAYGSEISTLINAVENYTDVSLIRVAELISAYSEYIGKFLRKLDRAENKVDAAQAFLETDVAKYIKKLIGAAIGTRKLEDKIQRILDRLHDSGPL